MPPDILAAMTLLMLVFVVKWVTPSTPPAGGGVGSRVLVTRCVSACGRATFPGLCPAPCRHPAASTFQSPMLPVQYLGCRPGLADEDERLVLGDVASELGVDNPLQTLELFAHVHRLHAEVVPRVRVKLAYC